MLTTQQQTDVNNITQATTKLAFYGAGKLAKNGTTTEQAVLAQLQTSFKAINLAQPPTLLMLFLAVISFLKALANITKNLTVQAIEQLCGDAYSAIFTPASGVTFLTVWADVRNLFSGGASGLVAAVDVTSDIDLFISSLTTMLCYALSKLSGIAMDEAQAAVANIILALDGADTVTDQEAAGFVFEIVDAGADLSNNTEVILVDKFLHTLYNIFTGNGNQLTNFIDAIKLKIQAKKAAKEAAAQA